MRSRKLLMLSLSAGLCVLATQEAGAKGCNGVVSQGEWGCAAWDNNNGPQYPHYKKPGAAQPAAVVAPSALAKQPQPVLAPNKGVSPNGAGLVASGGGNLVSSGGGNLVSSGGGNMKK
jgi:hypothetical protein